MTAPIIVIVLIGLALVWGFWLIFKKDMMSINLAKLLSYFAGVVITLLIVLWVTTQFLPWWAVELFNDTQQSQKVQELQQVTQNLWNQALNNEGQAPQITVIPAPTQPTGNGGTPGPTVSPPTTPQPGGEASTMGGSTQLYVVQTGDTLYSLARRYNTNVDELMRLNGLTTDEIKVGQTLKLP